MDKNIQQNEESRNQTVKRVGEEKKIHVIHSTDNENDKHTDGPGPWETNDSSARWGFASPLMGTMAGDVHWKPQRDEPLQYENQWQIGPFARNRLDF